MMSTPRGPGKQYLSDTRDLESCPGSIQSDCGAVKLAFTSPSAVPLRLPPASPAVSPRQIFVTSHPWTWKRYCHKVRLRHTYRPVRQDARDGQKANQPEARPKNSANSRGRCTKTRMISLRQTCAMAFLNVRVVGTEA